LPQVICPLCGAITDSRAADYPFCVGCQDNLAKCGYCRWYSPATAVCTHPVVAGVFEVSETATPPCVYHTPNERVVVRRRLLEWMVWALVGLVLVSLVLGVVRLREPEARVPRTAKLELVVEATYEGAVVGRPDAVTAVISNTSALRADDVRFEIAKRSLEEFELVSVSPRPTERKEQGMWEVFGFPPMRPLEQRRIVLEVAPKKAGTLHLQVRLVSDGNVFHGMADLPVIAEEARGGKRPARGRRAEEKQG